MLKEIGTLLFKFYDMIFDDGEVLVHCGVPQFYIVLNQTVVDIPVSRAKGTGAAPVCQNGSAKILDKDIQKIAHQLGQIDHEGVVRGLNEDSVELQIQLCVALQTHRLVHLHYNAVQAVKLFLRDILFGQIECLKFHGAAGSKNFFVSDAAQHHQHIERLGEISVRIAADIIAGPLKTFDKAHHFQHTDGFADRIAADAQLVGDVAFRGQFISDVDFTAENLVLK